MGELLEGRAPHFALVGNGPYLNRGCEAIVRGTMCILERYFGSDITASAGSFFGDRGLHSGQCASEMDMRLSHHMLDRWSLGPVRRRTLRWALAYAIGRWGPPNVSMRALASIADGATAALQVGGDNYSQPPALPRRFVAMDRCMARLGVSVVLWGASVGPFVGASKGVARVLDDLRKLPLILVRESESLEYLRANDISGNVHLVADPAFVMPPSDPQAYSFAVPDGAVGLNLSPLFGRHVLGTAYSAAEWTRRCTQTIAAFCRAVGRPIVLVPHVTLPGNDDHALMSAAAGALPADVTDLVTCAPSDLDAQQTKSVISRCAVFAGAREENTEGSLQMGAIGIAHQQGAYRRQSLGSISPVNAAMDTLPWRSGAHDGREFDGLHIGAVPLSRPMGPNGRLVRCRVPPCTRVSSTCPCAVGV